MPFSWQHFVYGSREIGRATARDKLRMADAFGATQAIDADKRADWQRDQQILAGMR